MGAVSFGIGLVGLHVVSDSLIARNDLVSDRDGLASFVLAGLIFFHWPSSSVWAVDTLVGISLLLCGIARITLPLSLREIRG
jgi:hypothetical protein